MFRRKGKMDTSSLISCAQWIFVYSICAFQARSGSQLFLSRGNYRGGGGGDHSVFLLFGQLLDGMIAYGWDQGSNGRPVDPLSGNSANWNVMQARRALWHQQHFTPVLVSVATSWKSKPLVQQIGLSAEIFSTSTRVIAKQIFLRHRKVLKLEKDKWRWHHLQDFCCRTQQHNGNTVSNFSWPNLQIIKLCFVSCQFRLKTSNSYLNIF